MNEEEEEEEGQRGASESATVKGEQETIMPLLSPEKLIISKPSNAYEFGQIINTVNASKDVAACAELLTMIEPKDLPILLSNKLEGDIFLIFIRALHSYVFCQDPGLVYQHLVYLSKAERFKVSNSLIIPFWKCEMLMKCLQNTSYVLTAKKNSFQMVLTLLNRNEMEQVQQLFDSLSKERHQLFPFQDLESLKRDFELQT